MSARTRSLPRHRRTINSAGASALALVALIFLAACGTTGVTLPVDDTPIAAFVVEAETALSHTPAFDVGMSEFASRGGYITQPAEIPNSRGGAPVAEIAFDLEEADEYALWVRVFAPSKDSDAVYLGFNGETRRVYPHETGRYMWLHVTTAQLAATRNVISLGHGEAGLKIDMFAVIQREDVSTRELEGLVQLPGSGQDPVPSDPEPAPPAAPMRGSFSLLGDEGFSETDLTAAQRTWFDRSLVAAQASASDLASRARQDDVYYYGRTLFEFSASALLGLRATGDLRFLDVLDPMMEAMRGQLYDGWCDGVDDSVYVNARYGTVTVPDGYRNFRYRHGPGRDYCRDTGDLNETLTHGHLAMVMYAYHVNRDLVSPAGVDYGERADFWFEYLREDFEEKWRSRTGVAWPAMDFIDLKFSHTYNVFSLYYYFIGMRLASEGKDAAAAPYLAKTTALVDAMFDVPYVPGKQAGGFVEVSGPTGDAVVYAFGSPGRVSSGTAHLEASPLTYTRYVMSAWLVLWLENVARWDDAAMMRVANGLTSFVIDIPAVKTSGDSFAPGVTGSETVGGIPATSWKTRMTVGKYGLTSIPAYALWDASGTIERVSLEAYEVLESSPERPSRAAIPLSMLFLEVAAADALGLTARR